MTVRPCHMIIRPNLQSVTAKITRPMFELGQTQTSNDFVMSATPEVLRRYRLAIHRFATVFPDAA